MTKMTKRILSRPDLDTSIPDSNLDNFSLPFSAKNTNLQKGDLYLVGNDLNTWENCAVRKEYRLRVIFLVVLIIDLFS